MGNFQVHLSPYNLQHSLHFKPLLPLYPQIQWSGKISALRNLNHLDKKHLETERFFHLPACFCLQSGWQCRTQADADEGSIKEQLCQPGPPSHLASTHTSRQAGRQMWSNLPLPYHILADDPLLFNSRERSFSESYLHTSKGKKKTTQHDPDTHSTIDPSLFAEKHLHSLYPYKEKYITSTWQIGMRATDNFCDSQRHTGTVWRKHTSNLSFLLLSTTKIIFFV